MIYYMFFFVCGKRAHCRGQSRHNILMIGFRLTCDASKPVFGVSDQVRRKPVSQTIGGVLTFINRINYRLLRSKPEISIYLGYFVIKIQFKFYAQLS